MNVIFMFQNVNLLTGGMMGILSSRWALGLFLIAVLVLVAILVIHALNVLNILNGKKTSAKERGTRFSMLNQLDVQYRDYQTPETPEISLAEFCTAFRNYAAENLHLYYSPDDIRRFVAGMGVTRLILLQGMSGTGKTSLAYAMGQFLNNESVVVPIQPMWKERSDMVGYFNEFTKKFNETTLLRKMYEAGYRKELYITVLDEVNISRIEYYFAEFLSLLELPDPDSRYLDIVNDVWPGDPVCLKDGKIRLPENMWFVGTANNDDSTFAISDKVYDRAMVLTLDKKSAPFKAVNREQIQVSYAKWCEMIESAKQTYSLSDATREKIGEFDAYLIEKFSISFGNRIRKQIEEYVPIMIACGGTELGAVDDILSKKVLRKLEQQNPVYIRNSAEELIVTLDRIFGDQMEQCKDYVMHLQKTV